MININLLPPEKRRLEKTPLPRFILILLDAVLAAAVVFYVIYLILQISDTTKSIDSMKSQLKAEANAIAEYGLLTATEGAIKKMMSDVKEVVSRDFRWSDIISSIHDVVEKNPKIWLDEIKSLDAKAVQTEFKKMDPTSNAVAKYGISLKCNASGFEPKLMTKFRMDLKTEPNLDNVFSNCNINPDFSMVKEDDYEEGVSMSFSVLITTTPEEPKAPEKKPTSGEKK